MTATHTQQDSSPASSPYPSIAGYQARPAHPARVEGGRQRDAKRGVHADAPQVSIVTIVFNGVDMLEQTIQSVRSQTHAPIEYIVIDGASTDGTLDLLRRYDNDIDKWISEPDRGIADAWNKGIALSSGALLGILNAGDTYAPTAVAEAVRHAPLGEPWLAYGTTDQVDEHGRLVRRIGDVYQPRGLWRGLPFLHPSCFATRATYEQVGLFRSQYKIAMDCDWIFRCIRQGVPLQRIAGLLCYMPVGGVSGQLEYAAYGEYLQSMKDNGFSDQTVRSAMARYAFFSLFRAWGSRLVGRK